MRKFTFILMLFLGLCSFNAFAQEAVDYTINSTTGALTTTKTSEWAFTTSEAYPAALTLTATSTADGSEVNAIKKANDDTQSIFYAYTQAEDVKSIKYTISVPEGYKITKYSLEYSLNSKSYPCTITYEGGTIPSPNDTKWYPLSSPLAVPAQSTSFTISTEETRESANFYIKNFIVTIEREASEGGIETGVEKVEAANETAIIYDLSGRQVEEITEAGIYIVNGVKVLVK